MVLLRAFASLAAVLLIGTSMRGQGEPDYEQPPVSYSATTPRDVVSIAQQQIAAGKLNVTGNDRRAVEALLEALDVSPDSQILVFSKTSLQRGRIRPERPRALYFSESVYVGWVPGGLMEITAIDPQLGPVFYSVELPAPAAESRPKIVRDPDCLRCHGGTFVREIPGVFARSIFPDGSGEPLLRHGTLVVDDETPFEQRWGGWYVTGYHGKEPHRGNVFGAEQGEQLVFSPATGRPDALAAFFDPSPYLRPTSDVVALLVFEHQMTVQNSLTRAQLTCRKMIAYQHGLQKAFNEPVTDEPAYDSVKSVFDSAAQDVVDRLLFRNAATLPDGVDGNEGFRKQFPRRDHRTHDGHSLKDLSLHGQLFANRCSYLIYGEAFRALPDTLKTRIFSRLQAALRGGDPKSRYDYLPVEERLRIYRILVETLPEAKLHWSEGN